MGSAIASLEGDRRGSRVRGSDFSSLVLGDVFGGGSELVLDEELPELELPEDEELQLELFVDEELPELDWLLDEDELLSESDSESLYFCREGFVAGAHVGERDACDVEGPFVPPCTVCFNFGAARSTELVGADVFN